jgi:cardiolipin synthase
MQADILTTVTHYWQYVALAITVTVSLVASVHALLYKRDPRAAALWVGFIAFTPLIGATIYFMFGVNRLRRRALLLREAINAEGQTSLSHCKHDEAELMRLLPAEARHLDDLVHTVSQLVRNPLVPGNHVEPLVDGDEAYPAMLQAIASAKISVTMATYIMDRDDAGLAFTKALAGATARGVEVRLLIDAAGTRYSWPSILRELRSHRIRHARFLKAFPLHLVSVNLRNHRKLLVVDGKEGFTGGLNIRAGHWLSLNPKHPTRDLHFRVRGPVVAQLQEAFAEDWLFTTGETLRGTAWFPVLSAAGSMSARGIADGPDEDFERLRWTILGALNAAQRSVRIATPYFLPDPSTISALSLAAMRGVEVDILLPGHNNLPFVHWASRAHWWQMLEHGCRIWLSPPPFDHSKLLVVDDCWSLVGSTNWDPRSLRLNFEFNLECYDCNFGERLAKLFESRRSKARAITLEDVDSRRLPARLRDGIARLFTPFL